MGEHEQLDAERRENAEMQQAQGSLEGDLLQAPNEVTSRGRTVPSLTAARSWARPTGTQLVLLEGAIISGSAPIASAFARHVAPTHFPNVP